MRLTAKYKPLFISVSCIILLAGVMLYLKMLGFGLTYAISNSMPHGFYLLLPAQDIKHDDIVLFTPPPATKQFLLDHHWGAHNGLLLKHIMGMPGDFVCTKKNNLWINSQKIAPIFNQYAPQQLLPHKYFCGKLAQDQYMLLSTDIDRSFDSRYFGPIDRKNILSKAIRISPTKK